MEILPLNGGSCIYIEMDVIHMLLYTDNDVIALCTVQGAVHDKNLIC